MIIGITGNSGAGKSTVVQYFSDKFLIVDADKIGHNILYDGRCKDEVVSFFGENITEDNKIIRSRLGEIVFNDKKKLDALTKITHKYIIKHILDIFEENKKNFDIIIDAPLLFESGLNEYCDITILIHANYDTKINRIVKRDNITKELAQARLDKQTVNDELVKKCDYVIENSDLSMTIKKVSEIIGDI